MFVKIPSVSRKGAAFSSSLRQATIVNEPTMIMAVTLFRNALNTTVRAEKATSRRKGSPRLSFMIFTLVNAKRPLREINSYVLTSNDRNLIIDTGMNRPECRDVLETGLDEMVERAMGEAPLRAMALLSQGRIGFDALDRLLALLNRMRDRRR